MIFNKCAKKYSVKREKPFQEMMLSKLAIHMQKSEFRPLLNTVYKK